MGRFFTLVMGAISFVLSMMLIATAMQEKSPPWPVFAFAVGFAFIGILSASALVPDK